MNKQTAAINIVQFTDPHLFADAKGGLYGLESLHTMNSVLAEIKQQNFDLGLVTGDLVQDESEAGYRLLHSRLKSLDMPLQVIPGNHDNADFMAAVLSDDKITCQKQMVMGGWQILLLNTQSPGEVGGHIDGDELDWLEQRLMAEKSLYTVICLHHHPIPMGSRWLDQIGLDNSDKLFEILAGHTQVKAVLWGHVHQELDLERAGLRLLACPSTCFQFKPGADDFELDLAPPGYRWLKLFPDGRLETGVRRLAKIPGMLDPDAKGYTL